MKLIGNLKRQVESENTMTGKKSLIEKAGMLLTDEELDRVSGGLEEGDVPDEEMEAFKQKFPNDIIFLIQ